MDTGRRPEEILRLRYDCLDTAADGKHVLVYAEFKIKQGRASATDHRHHG